MNLKNSKRRYFLRPMSPAPSLPAKAGQVVQRQGLRAATENYNLKGHTITKQFTETLCGQLY
jgi:hypothetical protein